MRMSSYEIADEILRQAEALDRRDANRRRVVYVAIAAAACLALVVGLSFAMPVSLLEDAAPDMDAPYSAAIFGGGAAGGYIFVGVLGFVLGAAVVYFGLRRVSRGGDSEEHERD